MIIFAFAWKVDKMEYLEKRIEYIFSWYLKSYLNTWNHIIDEICCKGYNDLS